MTEKKARVLIFKVEASAGEDNTSRVIRGKMHVWTKTGILKYPTVPSGHSTPVIGCYDAWATLDLPWTTENTRNINPVQGWNQFLLAGKVYDCIE